MTETTEVTEVVGPSSVSARNARSSRMVVGVLIVACGAAVAMGALIWGPDGSPGSADEFSVSVTSCELDGDVVAVTGELVPGSVRGDVWLHLLAAGSDEPDLAERWREAAATGDRNALPDGAAAGVWVRGIDGPDRRVFEVDIEGSPLAPVSCSVVEIMTPN